MDKKRAFIVTKGAFFVTKGAFIVTLDQRARAQVQCWYSISSNDDRSSSALHLRWFFILSVLFKNTYCKCFIQGFYFKVFFNKKT